MLVWGQVQRVEGNGIHSRVLYMRGGPRNRWQDEERENGGIVGGEGWQDV